jgi:hypothetical protein
MSGRFAWGCFHPAPRGGDGLFLPPRMRGRWRESAPVGEATARSERASPLPSTMLRMVPHPRANARGWISGTVPATRFVPGSLRTTKQRDPPPANKGRRSAERRMPTMCRACADKCTQSAPLICCAAARHIAARPPSGATPRLSSETLTSLTRLQAMLPGTRNQAGVTRSIASQFSGSTPRLGHSTEGNDARSRSGAGCEPARKHRTRPTFQIASGMRPSVGEVPSM